MVSVKAPENLEVVGVEEFFEDYYKFSPLHGDVTLSVSDRMREAYYDFVSLALQLAEYGFEPVGDFPKLDTRYDDDNFVFENRFADKGNKRVYIQRGVKNDQSYCNIGIRNYDWPGNPTFIATDQDMKKSIKPIAYGPNVISDIITGLDITR